LEKKKILKKIKKEEGRNIIDQANIYVLQLATKTCIDINWRK
jgi:hypothetical protein